MNLIPTDGPQALMMVGHGFSWLVAIGIQVALIVVAATAVRKRRPDVWIWFLGAGIAGGALSVITPVASVILNALLGSTGIDSYMIFQAVISVLSSGAHALVFAALLVGIVKLARPSNPDGRPAG